MGFLAKKVETTDETPYWSGLLFTIILYRMRNMNYLSLIAILGNIIR